MQHSPERLFDGIVSALTADVLPALDDPYARAQVLAAAEFSSTVSERTSA